MQGHNEEIGHDEDDDNVLNPTHSKVWENLNELINFTDTDEDFLKYL